MDIAHLKLLATFAIVVEEGSFASAARRLGTSRSRISEQIVDLEVRLGVRLLHRSTRKLSLTVDGSAVFEHARKLKPILEDIEEVVHQTVPKGRVALTVTYDVGISRLLPLLPKFEAMYPEIQLDLVLSDEKTDLIAEKVDLAIRIGIPKDETLISRVLFEEPIAYYASPDYLEANGLPETIEQLEEGRWIFLRQLNGNGTVILANSSEKTCRIQPQKAHFCNAPLILKEMVEQGMGIGSLLPSLVAERVELGRMVRVMPEWHGANLVFALVYSSRRQMPIRTRVLIDYLLSANLFDRP